MCTFQESCTCHWNSRWNTLANTNFHFHRDQSLHYTYMCCLDYKRRYYIQSDTWERKSPKSFSRDLASKCKYRVPNKFHSNIHHDKLDRIFGKFESFFDNLRSKLECAITMSRTRMTKTKEKLAISVDIKNSLTTFHVSLTRVNLNLHHFQRRILHLALATTLFWRQMMMKMKIYVMQKTSYGTSFTQTPLDMPDMVLLTKFSVLLKVCGEVLLKSFRVKFWPFTVWFIVGL